MGCDCAKTSVDRREPEERVLGLLEEGGLREIGEQTISIRAVMADSVRAFDKAGRAAALNLGDQVIQLHNDDGERANRQLRTQIRHLIERIDERMNRDDWGELSERLRVTFDEQDGRGLIDDWGAQIRMSLFEHDEFRPGDVGTVIALWDETAERVIGEGLSGSMLLLRERLQRSLTTFETPETGRRPFSPADSYAACAAVVIATAFAAGLVCMAVCLCCFGPFIVGYLVGGLLTCLLVLIQPPRT